MKTAIKITGVTVLSLMMLFNNAAFSQTKNAPVRVLLITGGHDYDESFDAYMQSLPGIVITHVEHPNALFMFRPENRASYDVVLLYDMPGTISDQEKKDFTDCLNAGKGLVVWHHAYGSYRDWPEYQNIAGGRYQFQEWKDSKGISYPPSTYKHDVQFRVKVADKKHPITKGISDFDIIDETYGRCSVNPGVHVLLTTGEPTSTPTVAWITRYVKSKVVTILLGHDQQAWNNPDFKKLLIQAIQWAK
jgi:type 1 glutamine amidotransferase